MRVLSAMPMAAALTVLAIGLSNPAAATTLNQALSLCNQHGGCQVFTTSEQKWVSIKYKNNEIVCPKGGGQCQCVSCSHPARTQPGSQDGKTGGVIVRDHRGPGAPSGNGGKPPVMGTFQNNMATGGATAIPSKTTTPSAGNAASTPPRRGASGGVVVR